jgi:hypothetical protein
MPVEIVCRRFDGFAAVVTRYLPNSGHVLREANRPYVLPSTFFRPSFGAVISWEQWPSQLKHDHPA